MAGDPARSRLLLGQEDLIADDDKRAAAAVAAALG